MRRRQTVAGLGAFALLAGMAASAGAWTPVDLNDWTAESYPAVAGFGAGEWVVAPDGESVRQTVNGQPTVFYSDFAVDGKVVRGRVMVDTTSDDDFIGFVLGFNPGDADPGSVAADYLLVDWKQADQVFDFGPPSDITPGGLAAEGLAVSRVRGVPTADEFWQHTDYMTENPDGGLTELARGATFGDVGWADLQEYEFRFVFMEDRVRVFVDDVLELDLHGSYSDGRFGFYNFSQADVVYSAFEVRDVAGCSQGFWRQPHHFEHWVGYEPGDEFDAVFGTTAFGDATLHEVISSPAGGPKAVTGNAHLNNLGRQAVGALLNAASDLGYPLTESEVIDKVADAIDSGEKADLEAAKDELDRFNNLGCPPRPRTGFADWNGDGVVDINDFMAFLTDFAEGQPHADVTGTGVVDVNDFFAFLVEYDSAQ